nr:winged helix-turn-helix domain-containing protein [Streptomyces olivoverticillatus]
MARTRIAPSPQPLLETSIAVRVLQETTDSVAFGAWRQQVRARLHPTARMILDLVPPRGWSPNFFHPSYSPLGAEEALEVVRATPKKLIVQELEFIAGRQRVPRWTQRLRDDPQLLGQLFDGLGHVYAQALSPYWPRIRTCLEADRALRAREFARGGVERVLAGLSPRCITWRPPVLDIVTASGFDEDMYLDGSGLLLVPSWFGSRCPVIEAEALPQPLVTYPAHREPGTLPLVPSPRPDADAGRVPAPLVALLGRTRAAVLHAIADSPGCHTTELARRLGIAPASASEHATVLRAAGLVITARHRNTALHTATAVGVALLNSPLPAG